MNKIMKKLEKHGVNLEEVMERFVGDEELYLECLNSFITDPAFDGLKNALDKKDYSAAFDSAHTLKGVSRNLGLASLYNKIIAVVEPLRHNEYANIDRLYQDMLDEFDRLKKVLGK